MDLFDQLLVEMLKSLVLVGDSHALQVLIVAYGLKISTN